MQLMTYNEALTELCDNFDALISPRTIARRNTNIIYLLFKAFAKGWEVINNVCVSLSGKFDPALCSDGDLESVAFLVGTERLRGSSSGLLVTAVNNSDSAVYLPAGTYTYALDEDTSFVLTITADRRIGADGSEQLVLLSEKKGSFPVTAQSDITVTVTDADGNDMEIPDVITFANADNSALLGYGDETDLEFRKRIIEDTDRQDIITELRDEIRGLPYVFDCDIKFNNTVVAVSYDGYSIPPYNMLLMVSGDYKDEIAEIVARKGVYPTVRTPGASVVSYRNPVFADGRYDVYITPYQRYDFSVSVTFYADDNFISDSQADAKIRTGLMSAINGNRHTDVITENDIFNIILSLNITGLKVLGVSVSNPSDTSNKSYIVFPKTRIPHLVTVTTTPQSIQG